MQEIVKNEGITQTEERLNDLPVTAEQAEEAKGGRGDIVPTDQISVNFTKVDFK